MKTIMKVSSSTHQPHLIGLVLRDKQYRKPAENPDEFHGENPNGFPLARHVELHDASEANNLQPSQGWHLALSGEVVKYIGTPDV